MGDYHLTNSEMLQRPSEWCRLYTADLISDVIHKATTMR